MSEESTIVRVDKFKVPERSCDEFLQRIRETHQILRRQPGFVHDAILEQVSGPGKFNIITIVEWESQDAIDAAKKLVLNAQAKSGFSPQETISRLGIEADIAYYKHVGSS